MQNYLVNGYELKENPETWELKKVTLHVRLEIEADDDEPETIEFNVSKKYGFDDFESISYSPIN